MEEFNFNFHGEEFKIKRKDKHKNLKKNLLLLILVLFTFFLFLEIVLRILGYSVYGFGEGAFIYDSILGYKVSPNYSGLQSIYGQIVNIQTNSKGMRDSREYEYNKRENTFRIVVLGDSFSFGNGAELNESYIELLRKKFENQNIEIINLGVPGYSISHEYLTLLNEGEKYNPDLVLIQFCPNDWGIDKLILNNGTLTVDKNQGLIANKEGFLVSYEKESVLRTIHLNLLWNLKTYNFFYTNLRSILSKVIANYWNKNQGVPNYFLDKNSLQYQEYYGGYYSLIEKMKDSTNAKIVLFIGPFNTDRTSQGEIQNAFKINYSVNPEQTKESVKEIATKLNISFVEVEEREKDIFLPVDDHWNIEGNELVAKELYEKLSAFL